MYNTEYYTSGVDNLDIVNQQHQLLRLHPLVVVIHWQCSVEITGIKAQENAALIHNNNLKWSMIGVITYYFGGLLNCKKYRLETLAVYDTALVKVTTEDLIFSSEITASDRGKIKKFLLDFCEPLMNIATFILLNLSAMQTHTLKS